MERAHCVRLPTELACYEFGTSLNSATLFRITGSGTKPGIGG